MVLLKRNVPQISSDYFKNIFTFFQNILLTFHSEFNGS